MTAIFDFAPNSHVAEEIPSEEPQVLSMNGWDFTARPGMPYRPKFKLTIGGLYWHLEGAMLDITTDAENNAGRLLEFYRAHRRWKVFNYEHEFFGMMLCRFAEPVSIPKAMPDAGGLVPPFELTLIQHNPGYGSA